MKEELFKMCNMSRRSVGLWAERPCFDSRQGQEIYFSSTASRPALGYRRFFPLEVKLPRHEADHAPPSVAEVKNGGAIPPLPMHLCVVVLN
jgi:hypothetical protein